MKPYLTILTILLFSLSFFSCRPPRIDPKEDDRLIAIQIEQFHKLYNEQKFGEIADSLFDQYYIKAAGRDKVVAELESLFQTHGRALNTGQSIDSKRVFDGKIYREVQIWSRNDFEKGPRREFFVFRIDDRLKVVMHLIEEVPPISSGTP